MGQFRIRAATVRAGWSGIVLLAANWSLSGQTITSNLDFPPPDPGQHPPVLALVSPASNQNILLVTAGVTYSSLLAGQPLQFIKKYDTSGSFILSSNSSVAVNPTNSDALIFTCIVGFAPAIVTYNLPSGLFSSVSLVALPTAMVVSNTGTVYMAVPNVGLEELPNAATGTPSLTFGAGIVGTLGQGLAIGPDGDLYVVDPNYGRVDRFDPTTGGLLGSFAISGATTETPIAFSPNGLLYVANGDGGGAIYNPATGASLGLFTSAGGSSVPNEVGNTTLDFAANGNLYLYDTTTGMHLFDDPDSLVAVPEPADYSLIAGLAALGFCMLQKRRRTFICQGPPSFSPAGR